MAELFFKLLIAICIGLLVWGIAKPERIYQYPFLMGSIFTSFLLPQAFSLVNNPGAVSGIALERVLIVSCLCAAMCWIGYNYKTNTQLLKKLYIPLNEDKLFRAGIILTIIGYIFRILLLNTNVEIAENSNWTGPATIFFFFAQVSNISFMIFMLLCLKRLNKASIIAAIISGYPLFDSIISAGRRQNTLTFLVIIGISLFFERRLLPPRVLTIFLTILTAVLIPIIGQMREDFWLAVFSGNLSGIDFQSSIDKVLEGEILELRNAALLMEAAIRNNQYGHGTGFWDSLVFQYVPGQIVGYDLKSSLQFNWTAFDLVELFGYSIPNGSTITGIGDSFIEFGYFGCLIFAFTAYFFKHLWISSVVQRSIFSQVLYAGMISPALVGLTHGIGRLLQELVFQLIFVIWIAYYCRSKYPKNIRSQLVN